MKLELYKSIKKFTDDVMDILLEGEIQNNMIISNCLRGLDGAESSNWFMGTVTDSSRSVQLIALMTPPHNLTLYTLGNILNIKATDILARELRELEYR